LLGLILVFGAAFVGSRLATGGEETNRAGLVNEATAVAALGRPLPAVGDGGVGLVRSAIALDPPTAGRRGVHISYAVLGRNVALLTIQRGALTPLDTQETVGLGGVSVSVATHPIADGTTDVGYAWSAAGYAYVLHVNLVGGIDRIVADRIAASVH
jgi:hypothetical protein